MTILGTLSTRYLSLCHTFRHCTSNSSSVIRVVTHLGIHEEHTSKLLAETRKYTQTHLDLGTGDGKFVYREAKENPSTLYIGIDVIPNHMSHFAWKATRKPSRGGLKGDNLRFIVSSVDDLPDDLERIADKITINFPWGSLLKSVTKPSEYTFRKISKLARPDSRLTIILNRSIYDDKSYLKKHELPDALSPKTQEAIDFTLRRCGFDAVRFSYPDKPEYKTSWGQKLTLGSNRNTIQITCSKTKAEPCSSDNL